MYSKKHFSGIFIVIAFVTVLATMICLQPEHIGNPMVRESGFVERATAFCYLLATVMLMVSSWRRWIGLGYSTSIWVLLLGLRELDFHDRFTTMGIFKTKFYISPEVPIVEKILVTLFVLALLVSLVLYARKYLPILIEGLRQRLASSYTAAAAICFMPATKFLNSNGSEIREAMAAVFIDPGYRIGAIEETAELGIPILIFIATIYAIKERRNVQLGRV